MSETLALTGLGVGLAGLGAWCRGGGGAVRWLAFAVALATAVVGLWRSAPQFVPEARPPAVVVLGSAAPAGAATSHDPAALLLRAAAGVGPRSEAVVVQLAGAGPGAWPRGPFGAAAELRAEPLPWAPDQLTATLVRQPWAGRPNELLLHLPVAGPWSVHVRLELAGSVLHDAAVALAEPRRAVPFLTAAPGTLLVTLTVALPQGELVRQGRIEVLPPPALLVAEPSGHCAAALAAQGFAVRSVPLDGPNAPSAAELAAAPALVLGTAVPEPFAATLSAAVADGLGLFALAPSFGAPGSAVRALLPLLPAPPNGTGPGSGSGPGANAPAEPPPPPVPPPSSPPPPPPSDTPPDPAAAGPVAKEPIDVDKHAIALVLVVDRSGSMGQEVVSGRSKMSYAKTSAWQTSQALLADDAVAVVTFGNKGAGRVELPLTSAQDQQAIRAGIERLGHARELTYLLSGLQVARQQFAQSRAAVQHVVVITDGEFDLDERFGLQREIRQMRQSGITVSILSIVPAGSADEYQGIAAELARLGGGQFLAESDASRVPVFVSAEVTRALQRVGRQPRSGAGGGAPEPSAAPEAPRDGPKPEPPVDPPAPPPPAVPPPAQPPQLVPVRAIADTPLLEPEPAEWPPLGGAVPGRAPLDARVLLVAGAEGWPLLAFGHRGLGRVGAFAADLAGGDGQAFRQEDRFPARLAKWLQHVQRADPPATAELQLTTTLLPAAPTPAAVLACAALAGQAPSLPGGGGEVGAAPRPDWRRADGGVPEWAPLVALAAMLVLAAGEWWARRRLLLG
ncbi:MAG: VWA domain-containing protein [Planctomycetes bacterium]|nr:VWA domain-containing protein [Planctomycetota bacterium]